MLSGSGYAVDPLIELLKARFAPAGYMAIYPVLCTCSFRAWVWYIRQILFGDAPNSSQHAFFVSGNQSAAA